ncbi:hypothetical protein [Chthonomonas calidirosea]|uniref:hypothetical protein n=1 Tax=Chthonomonas calidirosea TaxID=454171 RepID=UPI0005D2969E|nr:hypothetical protein [Chthonomonas calidirosea]
MTYAGGNCNGQPYTLSSNGTYGGSGSPDMQNLTITCSGQITATFTWVPDFPNEPPPPAVVVMQDCTAQWQCESKNRHLGTGNADNGLGFAPINLGDGTYEVGQSSSGQQYLIKTDSTNNFTENCTPSASITVPAAFGFGVGRATASVTYKASATPLMIVLGGSGINLNVQPEYLIGQQVTCSLIPGGLTPSNYQWTPPAACQPFKYWQRFNYYQGDSSRPQAAQLLLLGNQDLTQKYFDLLPQNPCQRRRLLQGRFSCPAWSSSGRGVPRNSRNQP